MTNKIAIFLLCTVLAISGVIRFAQVGNLDFPFTFDQARDMLDIRVLGGFYDFKISGPTTSIPGLNLGPFYYLFNLPAYWIGVGNPQSLVAWNIIWFLLSALVIFLFFKKRNIYLGLVIATVYLMAPQLFAVTRYFWNANSVVYFIVFYYLALWKFNEKRTSINALIFGVAAGLVIQFEAAFGSTCVAFALLAVVASRNKLNVRNFLVGVLPWFIPQVIYEITHKFQMSHFFWAAIAGDKTILGDKLPLGQVVSLHWTTISAFFEGQFMLGYGLGMVVISIAILCALKSKQYRPITRMFLAFFTFAFIFFSLVYQHELKPWYLEGIRVLYCFLFGIGAVALAETRKIMAVLIVVFMVRSFYLTIIDQSSYIVDNGTSNDPKNAANLATSINWIYRHANNQGFEAYNYVPEILDFSQTYMYWWYGNKTFGYYPSKVSYSLDPVPDYIRSSSHFSGNTKPSDETKIGLLYETTGQYSSWLKQFDDYCVVDSQTFAWYTTVEWREKCQTH